jgi:hypothetical protein
MSAVVPKGRRSAKGDVHGAALAAATQDVNDTEGAPLASSAGFTSSINEKPPTSVGGGSGGGGGGGGSMPPPARTRSNPAGAAPAKRARSIPTSNNNVSYDGAKFVAQLTGGAGATGPGTGAGGDATGDGEDAATQQDLEDDAIHALSGLFQVDEGGDGDGTEDKENAATTKSSPGGAQAPRQGQLDIARHVIQRILTPHFLSRMPV